MRGIQCVAKFNKLSRDVVGIHLALLRLPQFATDILITVNQALFLNANPEDLRKNWIIACETMQDSSGKDNGAAELLRTIVNSFQIKDESLFVMDEE